MDKQTKEKVLLALVILFLYGIINVLFMPRTVQVEGNPNQETIHYPEYYITGNRETRKGYDEIDGTDELIYVRSGQTVDAYDYQGNYQHTLVFTAKAQNGGTSIVCSPELLYVSTRNNQIHAFRGTEYLGTVTREEMKQIPGLRWVDGRVILARDGMYKVSESGEYEYICPVPEELESSMPLIRIRADVAKCMIVILLTLFFGLFIFFFSRGLRKRG